MAIKNYTTTIERASIPTSLERWTDGGISVATVKLYAGGMNNE